LVSSNARPAIGPSWKKPTAAALAGVPLVRVTAAGAAEDWSQTPLGGTASTR
jgi:hypothetical protein